MTYMLCFTLEVLSNKYFIEAIDYDDNDNNESVTWKCNFAFLQ